MNTSIPSTRKNRFTIPVGDRTGTAAAMFLESPLLVGSGAWALFAGVAIATVDAIGVVAQSMRRPTDSIRPAA